MSEKCGCYVRYPKCKGNTMSYVKNEIVYCPLHAHAGELLKMLELYHVHQMMRVGKDRAYCIVCDVIKLAKSTAPSEVKK